MADREIQDNVIKHASADQANVPGASADPPAAHTASTAPSSESVLWAEWRRGLKDLQNVVLDPWAGQAATHEEVGTIANPTQIEVTNDRSAEAAAPQQSYREMLDEYASRAPARGQDRDQGMER